MITELIFSFNILALGNSSFISDYQGEADSKIIVQQEKRKDKYTKKLISERSEEGGQSQENGEEGENEEGEEELETIIEEEPSLPYGFAQEEEKPELLTLKGYFRSRFFFYSGIPEVQNLELKYKNPFYVQSRLRLDPYFNISPTLRLIGQVDVFDDIVWGEGVKGFTPGEILCEYYNGGNNFSECKGIPRIFAIKRFWGEIDSILTLPLSISIGRQPVHYGLGIFYNDGNWFRNLWGDAHFGSTQDRLKLGVKLSDNFKLDDIIARYTGQGMAARINNIYGRGGEFFGTKGRVSGAWFLMPTFGLFPFEAVGTYLSVLLAFSNQNTLMDPLSGNPLFGRESKKGLLGVEIDWGLRIGTENFEFGTQLGYLILGKALSDALPEKKNTFKAQLRFTYLF
jgi:hypothetical protein